MAVIGVSILYYLSVIQKIYALSVGLVGVRLGGLE